MRDPKNNLVYEAHMYIDKDFSGNCFDKNEKFDPMIGVNRVKPFVDWLKQNKLRGYIGEHGIPDFSPSALVATDNLLSYLRQNCIPSTYWAAGPWWGEYALSLDVTSGKHRRSCRFCRSTPRPRTAAPASVRCKDFTPQARTGLRARFAFQRQPVCYSSSARSRQPAPATFDHSVTNLPSRAVSLVFVRRSVAQSRCRLQAHRGQSASKPALSGSLVHYRRRRNSPPANAGTVWPEPRNSKNGVRSPFILRTYIARPRRSASLCFKDRGHPANP